MKRFQLNRRRGVSLAETMVGIFIVAMIATMVGATLPVASRARGKADQLNRAMSLAQKQMESVRSVGYPNLTPAQLSARGLIDSATPISTNTYATTNVDNGAVDSPAQVLPSGTGTLTVEQVDLDLRRVSLTVNWVERRARGGAAYNRTYRLSTLVANL